MDAAVAAAENGAAGGVVRRGVAVGPSLLPEIEYRANSTERE
jgi:hypothetical protein